MAGKYLVLTLGCKVNQYESQQIRETLESFGLRAAGPADAPDIAVVNTCAVTVEACRKSRQAVRAATRRAPSDIVVVGCAATADGPRFREIEGVTAVLGHDAQVRDDLCALLIRRFGDGPRRGREVLGNDVSIKPEGPSAGRTSAGLPRTTADLKTISLDSAVVKPDADFIGRIDRFDGHQRAFLKVQDGCDAFCTYCIIPQLRPSLRSKPPAVICEEARALVARGHKEVILTGIFLGAYGRETAIRKRFGPGPSPLAGLVRALSSVEGLRRLRLSSLEPGDVDDALLAAMAESPVCVPHLHLPLQSGSERILRRMNRQYGRDDFLRLVERVRTAMDDPAITTDVLVGFPGETESDFEDTLGVARFSGFCQIHAFPFSPRPGTAAARWHDDFVPREVVAERMDRVGRLSSELSLAYRRKLVGRTERVIVESGSSRNGSAGR